MERNFYGQFSISYISFSLYISPISDIGYLFEKLKQMYSIKVNVANRSKQYKGIEALKNLDSDKISRK